MWKCNICGWSGDDPIICPAMDNGVVVDIIDVICPNCPTGNPEMTGTTEEKNEWWNKYYG